MKTMKKNKKFHSYDQSQLKLISDALCDDIENLLSALSVDEYKDAGKMIVMSCPIHGGDNDSAFNLYHHGDSYRGNWKCRTHKCEDTFKSSIIGFIRGCLSHNQHDWTNHGDDVVSFKDAIDFAVDFLKQDLSNFKVSKKAKEKNRFINTVKYLNNQTNTEINKVSKNFIRQNLEIPSKYFQDRGFSYEVLDKYDIGECKKEGKEMYNRAVAPIYDIDNKYMIGCSGRSVFDKCDNCKSFHDPSSSCPTTDLWKYSKWKHSFGFKSEEHLYNFWYAKEYIKQSGCIIIVESPGNVWRLEESGVHNSVAIFGSSFSDKQKMLVDISGAMTIYTIMDNDEAGKKAAEQIASKCSKTYNIKNINLEKNDIATMSISEIKTVIVPQLGTYK
jgi:5S rRNA maturation endonuclease (ribonuclease M5)